MSKNDTKYLLELLYRSFDAELTASEEKTLQDGLENNSSLRQEKENIVHLRSVIQQQSPQPFAPGFADRVMAHTRTLKSEEDSLFSSFAWSFRRLALIASASVLVLAFNNIIQADEVSLDSLLAMPTFSLDTSLSSTTIFGGSYDAE